MRQLGPLTDGFDESYTLTGCSNPAHCGTFHRVGACCASGNSDYCPGGQREYSGNTDTTMCAGVPAYQAGGGDGSVLFRTEVSSGRTRWWVVEREQEYFIDVQ